MSAYLPYLGLFGPISVILAAICAVALFKRATSGSEIISHERRVSLSPRTIISRI